MNCQISNAEIKYRLVSNKDDDLPEKTWHGIWSTVNINSREYWGEFLGSAFISSLALALLLGERVVIVMNEHGN